MGKKEDKITVSMAGKNKQVTANQKRMAANAWRNSKSDSARDRLREKFKKQGYSAADVRSIIAASKKLGGHSASAQKMIALNKKNMEGMSRDTQGLRKTFSTKTPYTHSKTTRPRRTAVLQEQRIGGPKRTARKVKKK